MNPLNKFWNEIKRLQDSVATICDSKKGVWPFGFSHECHEKDCFQRDDGLWEQVELHNTGQKQYQMIFLWRLHPNYCVHGQPSYSCDQEYNFMAKSETEKIVVTEGDYEFVWRWSEFTRPTNICWGMKMGKTFYEIRKNGIVICNGYTKAHLNRFWKENR